MEIKNKVEFYNINKKWVLFALALVSLKDHLSLDQDKVLNIIELMVVVRVSMSWFFFILWLLVSIQISQLCFAYLYSYLTFFYWNIKMQCKKAWKKWEGNQKSGVKKAKQAKEPPSPHQATCCQLFLWAIILLSWFRGAYIIMTRIRRRRTGEIDNKNIRPATQYARFGVCCWCSVAKRI